MNVRINMLIESEYQSQIQEKQARLEALQAQLDPHFCIIRYRQSAELL